MIESAKESGQYIKIYLYIVVYLEFPSVFIRPGMAGLGIDFMETLLTGLRAAAEPTRLRLLALCGHSELTVSELTQIVGQSQPRVSRHLKLLCDARLLDRHREGTWAFYRAASAGEGGGVVVPGRAGVPPGRGRGSPGAPGGARAPPAPPPGSPKWCKN